MRRFFSSIRNVGILAILLFSCVVVSAAPVKVLLAYPARSMSTLHIQVALEKGIFAKYGLNVEAI